MKSKLQFIGLGVLTFVLLFPGQGMASSSNQAKTDPPLEETIPFSIFDPNFIYLDDGSANISNLGNDKVSVWGQSIKTRKVDTIGVQLTLQRWTGNEWIDVNTGANTTSKDSSYAYYNKDINVLNGYYYRVKSRH